MLTDRQTASWTVVSLVALLAAIGLTFGPAVDAGFISLDDGNNIFLHPQLGALTWDRVLWTWSDFTAARRYMPLGWLGLSAVITVQGYQPAGFHLAGLIWHAIAALALLGASRNILRWFAKPADKGWANVLALVSATSWALHPLRVEVTAWASGLIYAQASALAFVALWLWTLRWSSPHRANGLAAGSLIAFLGSLLTYPIALGMPVACWVLDRSMDARRSATPPPHRPSVHPTSGTWLVMLGAGSVLTLAANLVARMQKPTEFAALAGWSDFGITDRLFQALYVWGRYIRQWIWPAELSPIYTDLFNLSAPAPAVIATTGAAAVLLVATIASARRHPLVLGTLVAYSALALPFLGLLEHPWIAHDRYATLITPALGIAVTVGLLRLTSPVRRAAVAAVTGGLIVAGAIYARTLVAHWRDEHSFNARLQATLPRDAAAGYYLGYLPASAHFLAGRFEAIQPTLIQAELNAPGWSAAPSTDEFRRLVQHHEEFVAQNWPGAAVPPLAVLHFLHGLAAVDRADLRTARFHLQAALAVAPDFSPAARALARCEETNARRR